MSDAVTKLTVLEPIPPDMPSALARRYKPVVALKWKVAIRDTVVDDEAVAELEYADGTVVSVMSHLRGTVVGRHVDLAAQQAWLDIRQD